MPEEKYCCNVDQAWEFFKKDSSLCKLDFKFEFLLNKLVSDKQYELGRFVYCVYYSCWKMISIHKILHWIFEKEVSHKWHCFLKNLPVYSISKFSKLFWESLTSNIEQIIN